MYGFLISTHKKNFFGTGIQYVHCCKHGKKISDSQTCANLNSVSSQCFWHCLRRVVHVMVECLSVCVTHSPAAAASGGFAALGPSDRRY